MQATANRDFNASLNGYAFNCAAGDVIEADAKTIEQLEAIGAVTPARGDGAAEEAACEPAEAEEEAPAEKGRKPGKAGKDD